VDKLGQGQSRPFPQFATISGGIYNGWSNYNSLQVSLNKRLSSGLSFGVNYTHSKFLDTQDSSGWGSRGGSQPYQSAYYPGQNYALSNFDVPNAFKGLVTYQLPFGKGRSMLRNNAAMDALFGGWQTSTIFVAQSGAPFTPTVSGTNNSGALSGSWYPNCVGDPSVSNQTIQQWFNPAAFAAPAKFTFGSCGRNILRGPGLSDIDFQLGKNFAIPRLGEASHIELRIDATNVLNHTSFGQPNSSIGNTQAGVITSTTVSGRTIQLGVRIAF